MSAVPLDKMRQELKVGQKVCRAASSGRSAVLHVCRVTRVENGKVYLDNSPQALIYTDRVVIVPDIPA